MPATNPSLKARLDYLEAELKQEPPGFILTADLPFAIFRYDPSREDEREWTVRREIQNLKVRTENSTNRTIHVLSLADLLWEAIRNAEGVDAVVQMERDFGFDDAQRQVGIYLSSSQFVPLPDLLVNRLALLNPQKDLVFLTRAAALAPSAYPVSILLEQILGRVKVPGILFYPGTWAGNLNFLSLRGQAETVGSYRVKIYGAE